MRSCGLSHSWFLGNRRRSLLHHHNCYSGECGRKPIFVLLEATSSSESSVDKFEVDISPGLEWKKEKRNCLFLFLEIYNSSSLELTGSF